MFILSFSVHYNISIAHTLREIPNCCTHEDVKTCLAVTFSEREISGLGEYRRQGKQVLQTQWRSNPSVRCAKLGQLCEDRRWRYVHARMSLAQKNIDGELSKVEVAKGCGFPSTSHCQHGVFCTIMIHSNDFTRWRRHCGFFDPRTPPLPSCRSSSNTPSRLHHFISQRRHVRHR